MENEQTQSLLDKLKYKIMSYTTFRIYCTENWCENYIEAEYVVAMEEEFAKSGWTLWSKNNYIYCRKCTEKRNLTAVGMNEALESAHYLSWVVTCNNCSTSITHHDKEILFQMALDDGWRAHKAKVYCSYCHDTTVNEDDDTFIPDIMATNNSAEEN